MCMPNSKKFRWMCSKSPQSTRDFRKASTYLFLFSLWHVTEVHQVKTTMHFLYVCTKKFWQNLLHCVVQLNEPCPWKAFLVVDVWEHGPTINPIFVKWYVCSVWGKYGTVFQLCKKTYRWSTSIVTLVTPGIYPENMNALVHTPCVIAPYNFVCIQETVQY